ncbi:MAG: hypothetical protein HKO65_00705 [Gemmatimonadetes bacterium]|nr:hypothetical protein [Gemmatimonadota bacterium]
MVIVQIPAFPNGDYNRGWFYMTELSPDLATPQPASRPEAMADVPGVCEVSLSRAVVQYRGVHEADLPEGRIEDIGLALVLDGSFASASQVLDLGSARVKQLDLSTELVVLDWVYEPTLKHVHQLLRAAADPSAQGRQARRALAPYCFDLAMRVLLRAGYGPLSRPILLRIGFRDICRDLDLHEGTSVRIAMGRGRLARARLDFDANALVFGTAFREPDEILEDALRGAFPARDLRRVVPSGGAEGISYQVRFPLPLSFSEARSQVQETREGLAHLLARFEPHRYRALQEVMETFGARETLARLHLREPREQTQPLSGPPNLGGAFVH